MGIETAMATEMPSKARFDIPSFLQWEIKFRIKEPTRISDRDLVLIKRTGTIRPDPAKYKIFKDVPFDPGEFKFQPQPCTVM